MGKTTIAKRLANKLTGAGIDAVYVAFPDAEPGTLGAFVHLLHDNPEAAGVSVPVHATSVQLLHVAAHVDTIQRSILPSLKGGTAVILDRYWWSTWVYGLAAGIQEDILKGMIEVELAYWEGVLPDLAVLVQRRVRPSVQTEELWKLYERVGLEAKGNHPVQHLSNDGPVDRAVEQIQAALGSV